MISNFYSAQRAVGAHLGPASQRRHQQPQYLHSEHLFSPLRSLTIALCEQQRQFNHLRSNFTVGVVADVVIGDGTGAVG